MSNTKYSNLGILVSEVAGFTPWIDIANQISVKSAQKSLETLASRIQETGLMVGENRLPLFEVACELGTCFYDCFNYSLGNQSKVYISLDGKKILHLQSVNTERLKEQGSKAFQEEVNQVVLKGLGNLLKLFEVKEDPLEGLLYLPHPLDLNSHHYTKMCIYPDGEEPFSGAIRNAFYDLGFRDMNEGSTTLNLFGRDSVRLYQEGDARHLQHLLKCLKERIIADDKFKDIASNFRHHDFKRVHVYDK